MKKIKIVFLFLGLFLARDFLTTTFYQDFDENGLIQISFGYEHKHTYSTQKCIAINDSSNHRIVGTCTCGAKTTLRTEPHSFGDKSIYDKDSEYHYYTRCECGQKFRQPHSYGNNGICECGQKGNKPTTTTGCTTHNLAKTEIKTIQSVSHHRIITYCTNCSYRIEKDVPHNIIERRYISNYAYGDNSTYHYYTKCDCGQTFQQAHTFENGTCYCGASNQQQHVCQPLPWSGSYAGWLANGQYHWQICSDSSCKKELNKTLHSGTPCSACGYKEEQHVCQPLPWSGSYAGWLANGQYHWQICSDNSCKKELNKTAHSGTPCKACGYKEEQHVCAPLPWSGNYSGWAANQSSHWQICATESCKKVINQAPHDGIPCNHCGYQIILTTETNNNTINPEAYTYHEGLTTNNNLPKDYQDYTYKMCEKYGITEYYNVILAQQFVESRYNTNAQSKHDDRGLAQIWVNNVNNLNVYIDDWSDINALGYSSTDGYYALGNALYNPKFNIECQVAIISNNLNQYNNDITAALIAYNEGPGLNLPGYLNGYITCTNYTVNILDGALPLVDNSSGIAETTYNTNATNAQNAKKYSMGYNKQGGWLAN